MTGNQAYLTGLDRNQANYASLTPFWDLLFGTSSK